MRAYCRCTAVQNYDYTEAAERLKCKPRFLKDNISRLPHQKLGESVAFCDCELALIQRMFTILPGHVEELLNPPPPPSEDSSAPLTLRSIRPSGGRTKTSAVV